jgi:hypothetical protein
MLYGKLVARISEATRTLVSGGRSGRFDQNSTIFVDEVELDESSRPARKTRPRLGWLKICDGPSRGTYQVVRAHGNEIHVAEPFPTSGHDVEWQLYDVGVSEEDVRKALLHFPEVLMELEEGEQVKTYLGVIKIVRRKRKRVKDPQGRWTHSPERLQARLRPGKRLQRLLDDDPSEPRTAPQSPPDEEDPEL